MSISLDQAYQIFMADRETSCADKTLIYYRENLTGFFTYVSECFNRPVSEIGCDEVTRGLFRNYICYLRKRPKFQNHPSWNRPRNCFVYQHPDICQVNQGICQFLQDNEYCDDFTYKVKLPKDDSGEIIPLYQSEVQQIDKLFNLKTEFGLRNWCIVHLMLDAGLRSSEVINLRFCDLMFDKNIIQVYKSKRL